MSVVYKTLKSDDISITPFKAYKTWSTLADPGLITNNSISQQYADGTVFTGSWKPTYNSLISGSGNDSSGSYHRTAFNLFYKPNYGNYFGGFNVGTSKSLVDYPFLEGFHIINISRKLYGEEIRRGSFILYNDSYTITDDGEGNLHDELGNFAGNIFYEQGILPTVLDYFTFFNGFQYLTFQGTVTKYEYEIKCKVEAGEYNHTLNPTTYSGSYTASVSGNLLTDNAYYKSYTTHSEWNPYITNIGLYDQWGNLLVHAKPSQPIKKNDKMDTTFIIRFDR